ncbi:MAG: TetR/AcrR family transcriptional regulator [Actinomycetaceae bacterium]|nr:TetR/AcrR family transcriptional regulator [Actinomycetaceae bacterium]
MPKIIGETLAEHRHRTRESLFEALSHLLSRHTFDSLTMAKIAKEAGVGRTAVYNHFEDKEDLLLAFIAYETAQYSIHLRKALQNVEGPIQQLRVYIREYLILGTSYHLAPGTDLRHMVRHVTSQGLHSHATIVESILRDILKRAMTQKRIPEQNLTMLVHMINSCLAGKRLPDEPRSREFIIHSTQIFILRAIGVPARDVPTVDPSRFFGRYVPITEDPFQSLTGESSFNVTACPIHQTA